jgi:hypothetical protein
LKENSPSRDLKRVLSSSSNLHPCVVRLTGYPRIVCKVVGELIANTVCVLRRSQFQVMWWGIKVSHLGRSYRCSAPPEGFKAVKHIF